LTGEIELPAIALSFRITAFPLEKEWKEKNTYTRYREVESSAESTEAYPRLKFDRLQLVSSKKARIEGQRMNRKMVPLLCTGMSLINKVFAANTG